MDSSKVFQEKMKDLGIPNDQKLNQFIRKYGQFSFGDSQLMLHPKPIHGLVFRTNSQKKNDLHIQCIWFKDKIKVYQIRSEINDF
jgi:hypothetical protein